MSIKIGDKIRIKTAAEMGEILAATKGDVIGEFSHRMWRFTDREATVYEIEEGWSGELKACRVREFEFLWDLRLVDLIPAAPKYQVGDKVTPTAKLGGSNMGACWNRVSEKRVSKEGGSAFLYVASIHMGDEQKGDYTLTDNANEPHGDWFLESDLTPYVEPPKYKVGDKVVPIGFSGCDWNFEKWLSCGYGWQKFFKKNGYLFIVGESGGKFICSYDHGQAWGDGFLASELEPYVEPVLATNCAPEYKIVNALVMEFTYTGPTTICTIMQDGQIYSGSSACMPGDVWNEETGRALAKARALMALDKGELDALLRDTCSKLGGE